MVECEKDLSFVPVEVEKAKTLSRSQIEFYNREGYVNAFDAFTGTEIEQTRSYFNDLLYKVENVYGGNSYTINGYHSFCKGIANIMMNTKILDCVEDIIGPNIIAWGSHFFCKNPGDPKTVPFHQDASYWPFETSRTVTVWLAIDDADSENSAMMFIPQTHDKGHLEWKESKDPCVLSQEIVNAEQMGDPIYNTLKAGQFSMHADMLAHGSKPNSSNRRRCGLTIRYCPPSVKAIQPGWAKNAFLCRGEDNTGHWVHRPIPDEDNLEKGLGGKKKSKEKTAD